MQCTPSPGHSSKPSGHWSGISRNPFAGVPRGKPFSWASASAKMLPMPKPLLLFAFFTSIVGHSAYAQEATGFRINGLTSAERDSLAQQIQGTTDLELVYACVPAGVLVFGANALSTSRAALRSQALGIMAPVIAADRIGPVVLDLQAAEAACETARGE